MAKTPGAAGSAAFWFALRGRARLSSTTRIYPRTRARQATTPSVRARFALLPALRAHTCYTFLFSCTAPLRLLTHTACYLGYYVLIQCGSALYTIYFTRSCITCCGPRAVYLQFILTACYLLRCVYAVACLPAFCRVAGACSVPACLCGYRSPGSPQFWLMRRCANFIRVLPLRTLLLAVFSLHLAISCHLTILRLPAICRCGCWRSRHCAFLRGYATTTAHYAPVRRTRSRTVAPFIAFFAVAPLRNRFG